MKKSITILFFAIISLSMACNNSANQTAEQQAWDEVMAVHDEVMPKTAELNRLATQLRSKIATLDSTQQESKNTMMDAILAIERADEGMMNWMAEVQDPEILHGENKTHEEIMRYLNEEKNKVNVVRDNILAALERGNQLLENTPVAIPDSTSQQ